MRSGLRSFVISLSLRCYPKWWRNRYGAEAMQLAEDLDSPWRTAAGYVRKGFATRLLPVPADLAPAPLASLSRSSGTILSWSMLYVVSALVAVLYTALAYPHAFGGTSARHLVMDPIFADAMGFVVALVVAIVVIEGLVVGTWLSVRLLRDGDFRGALVATLPFALTASLLAIGGAVLELHVQIRQAATQDAWVPFLIAGFGCCYGAICLVVSAWAFRRTRSRFEQARRFILFDWGVTLAAAATMFIGWLVLLAWGIYASIAPLDSPVREEPFATTTATLGWVWWLAVAVAGLATLRSSLVAGRSIRRRLAPAITAGR